jgi:GNAT superfamily N-acetyltransferase
MLSTLSSPTAHGTLTLRPETASAEDAAFVYTLFAGTKAAEMALMPLDDAGKTFLLRMQYRSMTMTYRQQYPDARYEIAELDGVPVGRLVTDVQADCVYYVDIAVLPDRQGGGVATALMQMALEEPKRLGLPGRVKVMSSNVASLRLCQKLGMTLRQDMPPMVELEWRAS